MKMTTRNLVSSVALGGAALAMTFGSIDRAQAASIVLGNTGSGVYTVSAGGSTDAYINPAWLPNDGTSSWIGSPSAPAGNYTYSTTFSLAGLIPTTASIVGTWAGDNTGVSILLNNSATGITANAGSVNFAGFTPFSIASSANFLAGSNTLTFTINNSDGPGSNPTGLRVAMTGTAEPVPEPSDLMGTAVAFGSVILLKRKMTKKKAG